MSVRPQPSRRPTRLRSATGRLAIGGAAGLAALAALAPAASALDDPPPIAPESEPETVEPEPSAPETSLDVAPAPDAAAEAPAAAAPSDGAAAAAPALAPNFGYQKYRVGVRLADGSYVPEGTTTAGTTFAVTPGEAKVHWRDVARHPGFRRFFAVTPAKAGVSFIRSARLPETPAFAGVTQRVLRDGHGVG